MPAALDWSIDDSVANTTVRIRSVPWRATIGAAAAAPIVTTSSSAAGTLIDRTPMPTWYLPISVPLYAASAACGRTNSAVANDRSWIPTARSALPNSAGILSAPDHLGFGAAFQVHVRAHQLARVGLRGEERELAAQHGRRRDHGQAARVRAGLALLPAAEPGQVGLDEAEPLAVADRADDQVRQRA